MRTDEESKARDLEREPDARPYPSWTELVSRLRGEQSEQAGQNEEVAQSRDWHDLVADMIVGR